MSGNRFNAFSNHGVGIGLRIPHYQHIFSRKPVVDWFEIISENFMIDGGRPLHTLDRILEQYRVVQHGVSMYFGSVTEPDPEHLRRLKALVRRTGTPWLSDHLCWGSVDGTYTHDLLPLPYTWEAVSRTAERVRKVGGTTIRSIGHIGRLQRLFDNDADYVTPEDMLRELHAGRFHAHHGLLQGNLTYFTEDSLEEAAPGLAT